MFSYKKVQELLVKNNVTAYKVAKETGISPVVFSDWKSGKSCPKVDKAKKIADYFSVPIESLLEDDPAAG